MLGVMQTREAIYIAQRQGLDLVEMQPNADPPVCRIMDYGKYRYDEGMKKKAARKQQQKQVVKEIKFHANVDRHDLDFKMKQMRAFIADGNKVKLTLAYRGRENAHKDLGIEVMQQVVQEMADVAICEQQPKVLGRLLGCLLAPKPTKGKAPKKPQQQSQPQPQLQTPAPAAGEAESPETADPGVP